LRTKEYRVSSLKVAGVAVVLGLAACGGQAEEDLPPSFNGGLGSNGAFQPPRDVGGSPAVGMSARGGSSSACLGAVCGAGGVGFAAGGNTSAAGGAIAVAGAGGAGGVAGAGGSSFVPDPVSTLYGFDLGLDGFIVDFFCVSPNACASVIPSPGDDPDATVETDFVTWGHDEGEGFQGPGFARLVIRFEGSGGFVDFAKDVPSLDLSNKRITVEVKLESGPITTAALYVKTGVNHTYADAGKATLIAGQWVQLAFPGPSGVGFMSGANDMGDVREIGIELASATPTNLPAVVFIDSVRY
jgi:hypothetical protein